MISIGEYIDVREKARELGTNIPTGITILPRNFASASSIDDLEHEADTQTLRILWREKGLVESPLEPEGETFSFIVEEAFGFTIPLIFLASTFIIQNPHLIDLSINILANYLTNLFEVFGKKEDIDLSYIIEDRKGNYKEMKYKGNVEGLKELPKVIKSVHDE